MSRLISEDWTLITLVFDYLFFITPQLGALKNTVLVSRGLIHLVHTRYGKKLFGKLCLHFNKNHLNLREQFELGPGFEPRTSRSLSWRSTTRATLVQLTVQI